MRTSENRTLPQRGLEPQPNHPLPPTLGESRLVIGKLLRRTQVQTNARYAHLAADPVTSAVERDAPNIAALMDGELAEGIPLRTQMG